jgi:hypothetical protein
MAVKRKQKPNFLRGNPREIPTWTDQNQQKTRPSCVEKVGRPFLVTMSQKGKTTGSADKYERPGQVREFLSNSRNCHKRKNSGIPQ